MIATNRAARRRGVGIKQLESAADSVQQIMALEFRKLLVVAAGVGAACGTAAALLVSFVVR